MARSIFLLHLSRRRVSESLRSFFFIPAGLALITSLFVIFYISSTSNLFTLHPHHHHNHRHRLQFFQYPAGVLLESQNLQTPLEIQPPESHVLDSPNPEQVPEEVSSKGDGVNDEDVFHDREIFTENYNEMNRSFKIYMYPHQQNDPFANVLLPIDSEPEGNYASESYFKKTLSCSHFLTEDPSEADLFYMPFSIARLRHDPRVGTDGIQDFIRDYIVNVSHSYPYWNRTGGADHFYVACHSIGRMAIDKAVEVKLNAIQVVCSSSYFQSAYVPHKDASLPQIWPREKVPPDIKSTRRYSQENEELLFIYKISRKKLAFFAGAINSPVREKLLQAWQNDSEISVHYGHLKTPYEESLLDSKFCLHVKGFEVNTARIGDALYYGCVPVIIANHYDLPFADILNWKSFSVIVATLDIPLLKNVLSRISFDDYVKLHNNVFEVRKHFQWHVPPVEYDAFYMVMYELWLRRSSLRIPLG